MSFIAKIQGLDQCFGSFITPKDVEMFQSKLLDTLKTIYYKLNFSYSCCLTVKLGRKIFCGCYLIQRSHYLWMVDVIFPLHGLAFEVIC